jgi:hypothetical protein
VEAVLHNYDRQLKDIIQLIYYNMYKHHLYKTDLLFLTISQQMLALFCITSSSSEPRITDMHLYDIYTQTSRCIWAWQEHMIIRLYLVNINILANRLLANYTGSIVLYELTTVI